MNLALIKRVQATKHFDRITKSILIYCMFNEPTFTHSTLSMSQGLNESTRILRMKVIPLKQQGILKEVGTKSIGKQTYPIYLFNLEALTNQLDKPTTETKVTTEMVSVDNHGNGFRNNLIKNSTSCTSNSITTEMVSVDTLRATFNDFFTPNPLYQDVGKECPVKKRSTVSGASMTPGPISDDPLFRNPAMLGRMMND